MATASQNIEKLTYRENFPPTGIVDKPRVIEFNEPTKFDPTKEFNDLVNDIKGKPGNKDEIKIGDFMTGKIIIDEDLKSLGKEEKLLQQAKLNISLKKYVEALNDIDELLLLNMNHHEAIYLKALCLIYQCKELEGFEILRYFLENKPSIDLQNHIDALIVRIRTQVVFEIIMLSALGVTKNLTQKLDALIKLDESYEPYYFILATILFKQRMLNEALGVVMKGISSIGTDKTRLNNIKVVIEDQLIESSLLKVVAFIKARHYKFALSSLLMIDPKLHYHRIFVMLKGYITQLDQGSRLFKKKAPNEIPLVGVPTDVYMVQSIITKEELNKAVSQIMAGKVEQALPFIAQASSYVSHYPFLHYLKAFCIYQRYFTDFINFKFRNTVEQTIADLTEIKGDSEIALKDANIQDANRLHDEIMVMLNIMNEVLKQRQLMQKDIERVNKLIKSFEEIMTEGTAIRDLSHLQKIRKEMVRIKSEAEKESKTIASPEGKKVISQVLEAANRNLAGLDPIEKQFKDQEGDIKIIKSKSEAYKSFVDSINSGSLSIQSRNDVDGYMNFIKINVEGIESDLWLVNSEAAKTALKQILKNWESLKEQFQTLRRSMY